MPRIRLIERPPLAHRLLVPGAVWRRPQEGQKAVYLTFDDGPIPEVTPWVLEQLEHYGVKATFFMVGDNARRHADIARQVRDAGHAVGNHTMHHLQGLHTSRDRYLADIEEAAAYVPSRLFRPPHGLLRMSQIRALRQQGYTLVMHDVLTRDYAPGLTADDVEANVRDLVRDGSIIVFHDSLKSWPRLQTALPRCIEWLQQQGYELRSLPI